MNKTELARVYADKYLEIAIRTKKPISKREIAVILWTENKELYKDVEDARVFIRNVLGSNGSKRRRGKYKDTDLQRQFATLPEMVMESETDEPFIVPTSIKKTLWIADIHSLFYSRPAFETAIEYGLKKGCDSVIILGDFMDYYSESKFDKNPLTIARFQQEREWGIDVLELLQDAFGYVVLKQGNHDIRRERQI